MSPSFSWVKAQLTILLLFCTTLQAADLWLAVGYGGRRMISTDGKTWEITAEWQEAGGDDGNNLMSAVWAKDQFVVTGGGGGGKDGAGHILVSKDGRVWTETYKDKARINPIVFGAERFVVGTSSYPSGKLMWSTDAVKWTEGAKIAAKGYTHFRGGAFGNGVFVLTGNGGGSGGTSWAIVTPDGEKITKVVAVEIAGARTRADAEKIARAIGNSLLVKSSWYGEDPNWGRLADAAGYARTGLDESRLDIYYDDVPAVLGGKPLPENKPKWKQVVKAARFAVRLKLNLGDAKFRLLAADLTDGYVNYNKSE